MKVVSTEFIKSATEPSQYPEGILPEIAFAGKSNVGKSSLINTITQRKNLARTSSTPGCTQLINFFTVNNQLSFVDLPGYGFAKVPETVRKNWKPMIEKYLTELENFGLIVRYNVNGIELSEDGFKKLTSEINLKAVSYPASMNENVKLYTGKVPTVNCNFQPIAIRESAIYEVKPETMDVIGETCRKYYEVCTHQEIYDFIDSHS